MINFKDVREESVKGSGQEPAQQESPADNLYQQWLDAKEAERKTVEYRRWLEDQMLAGFDIPDDFEGSKTLQEDGYKIKLTGRINRSVNTELLQQIAAEAGLYEHLAGLFRWKADLNKKAWEAADSAITAPLSAAITAKPGRVSFSIEKEGE